MIVRIYKMNHASEKSFFKIQDKGNIAYKSLLKRKSLFFFKNQLF